MARLEYENRQDTCAENSNKGLLADWFGPSKREVWSRLAEQIHGDFVSGGFFRRDKVVATTDQWTVTLDTFTRSHGKSATTYTRLRAPFVNKDGFRFKIYRAGIFTGLGEMLGMQDIRIGDDWFDQAFVIKSNCEERVRTLLSDPNIKLLLEDQPRIRLEVRDDEGFFGTQFPAGVVELYFVATGVIKDIDLLRGLFNLFAAILHQLCQMGSAYAEDPQVKL